MWIDFDVKVLQGADWLTGTLGTRDRLLAGLVLLVASLLFGLCMESLLLTGRRS
jgi:hypothetical protein